jgi:integration host factor subunit beta
MTTVQKSQLIDAIIDAMQHVTVKTTKESCNTLIDSLSLALSQGQHIEVRDFGSFTVKHRTNKKMRNPKTGAIVKMPEGRNDIHFKPGKRLRVLVAQT